MLQNFMTKSIFLSNKSIIFIPQSAEILRYEIVNLSQNFKVYKFQSFWMSKKCKSKSS